MPNEKLLKFSVVVVLLLGLFILGTACAPGDYHAASQACMSRCSPYAVKAIEGWGKGSTLTCTCDTRKLEYRNFIPDLEN